MKLLNTSQYYYKQKKKEQDMTVPLQGHELS